MQQRERLMHAEGLAAAASGAAEALSPSDDEGGVYKLRVFAPDDTSEITVYVSKKI